MSEKETTKPLRTPEETARLAATISVNLHGYSYRIASKVYDGVKVVAWTEGTAVQHESTALAVVCADLAEARAEAELLAEWRKVRARLIMTPIQVQTIRRCVLDGLIKDVERVERRMLPEIAMVHS